MLHVFQQAQNTNQFEILNTTMSRFSGFENLKSYIMKQQLVLWFGKEKEKGKKNHYKLLKIKE